METKYFSGWGAFSPELLLVRAEAYLRAVECCCVPRPPLYDIIHRILNPVVNDPYRHFRLKLRLREHLSHLQ